MPNLSQMWCSRVFICRILGVHGAFTTFMAFTDEARVNVNTCYIVLKKVYTFNGIKLKGTGLYRPAPFQKYINRACLRVGYIHGNRHT